MQATQIPSNQPRIGYAYDAIEVCGRNEVPHQVVYMGYQNGRPVVNNGVSQFYAIRKSGYAEEPVYIYNVADKIR